METRDCVSFMKRSIKRNNVQVTYLTCFRSGVFIVKINNNSDLQYIGLYYFYIFHVYDRGI